MKDLNFLNSNDLFIDLPFDLQELLIKQIDADSNFFETVGIMDYSLLLGIIDDE